MPVPPKPPELRQRRNKTSTRATLPSEEVAALQEVPALPDAPRGGWHSMVVRWWDVTWRSPMAAEYLEADKEELYVLARLHQDFWKAKTASERKALAAEIRQQGIRFGLSPIDRRRLQWEVEKGEQAEERTKTRRARRAPEVGADPREVLKVV